MLNLHYFIAIADDKFFLLMYSQHCCEFDSCDEKNLLNWWKIK